MAEEIAASAAKWIGSLVIQETYALFEVKDQLENLRQELEVTRGYLRDADTKQDREEVRIVTEQIRKLAYHMEDVIDTYIVKVEAKIKGEGNCSWLMKFAGFLHSALCAYGVGKRIKDIQEKMEQKRELLRNYGVTQPLRSGLHSLSYNERQSRKKPPSYPHEQYDECIVGLAEDIPTLVEILMGEGNSQIKIVSIVGMGGSGKTTLARKLYNHQFSKDCFDCFAWVSVSQKYHTEHVLSEILRQLDKTNEATGLNSKLSQEGLVDKLQEILEKKSCLVVLDDVWSNVALDDILPGLLRANNERGSKIIITARNQEVFQPHLKHTHTHVAKPLAPEHEQELFNKIAFNQCTPCDIQSFEKLRDEMLRKCGGLPLAIVALAGILSTKETIREWQQVSEAVQSRVMESKGTGTYGTIGDLLALSYDDLPHDLKPCFLYLGVFPEDCQIATGMLIRMWIGEGIVTAPADKGMSLEDIAMQHLENLSHRFMVQVVKTNFKREVKAIRVHDLLRDLCVKKAREKSFLEIYAPTRGQVITDDHAPAMKPRRAALHSCTSISKENSHLRSLVLLEGSSLVLSASISKDMPELDLQTVHNNFKLLRLLSLWGIKTSNGMLPDQIGSLIHLRYLGIGRTNITKLPNSIGKLKYLLTLDYRNIELDVSAQIEIPNVLYKLVRLRHLFLPIECPWSVANLNLYTLEYLQTLWGVRDDSEKCWLSREFQKLSATLRKLKIVASSKEELVNSFSTPSISSDALHTFHCELRDGLALQHVKSLSKLEKMHKLTLIGQLRMKLSLLLPANIIILQLKDSKLEDEDPMTALGKMKHLKFLELSNAYLGTILACEAGSFPLLEELHLHNFQNLETWKIEMGAMMRLKKLEITGCKKLQQFPQGLELLNNVKQLEFFGMPKEFGQKAREYGWSQKKLKLPHRCEALIEKSDSPIDTSSVHRIYEQLIAGIFLNNKQQKYWVVKENEIHYNCFMVFSTDLSLATQVDEDGLPIWNARLDVWKFSETTERDGALIKVAKLSLPLIHVLDISGRFNIGDLSPNVTYTIDYVIRSDYSEVSVQTVLVLPGGRIQTHRKNLHGRSSDEWVRVSVGEFETCPHYGGVAEFFLHFQWAYPSKIGFEIRGAIIEPKLLAADI